MSRVVAIANSVAKILAVIGWASPFLLAAAVAAAAIHGRLAMETADPPSTAGVWTVCIVHLAFAAAVYWHLSTGGWLEATYRWDDPNIANASVGVFELAVVVALLAFWTSQSAFFYLVLRDLVIVQAGIAACVATFIGAFYFSGPMRLF